MFCRPHYLPPHIPWPEEPVQKRSGLKVAVTFPYEDGFLPDGIHIVPMPDLPVVDAMGDVFKNWCPRQAVIISAPTGSGKSTYVAKIVNFAKTHHQHILVLSHRSLINGQQKQALAKLVHSQWANVNDSLAFDLTQDFRDSNLTLLTYQAFARQYQGMDLEKFRWVILDEAHFFHTDALFNGTADRLLSQIPKLFSKAHRVYMTATPEAVLEDIVRVEKAAERSPCKPYQHCFRDGCGQILMYQFPRYFKNLNLRYFSHPQEFVPLIKAHPGERFLIFVSAREKPGDESADSYASVLQDAGITVSYLDRELKGSPVWNELLNNNRFSAQVLVTTSVIDCGVNIIDDSLRHVVVETTNKTELIQMLGRKRCSRSEAVNVYIRAASMSTVNWRFQKTKQWLKLCEDAFETPPWNSNRTMLLDGWIDDDVDRPYASLLVPSDAGGLYVKLTAYHALLWQQGSMKRLLHYCKEYGDHSALPRLVHEWLEDPNGYSDDRWLHHVEMQNKRLELVNFLNAHKDAHFTDDSSYRAFCSKLQSYTVALCEKAHDKDRILAYGALNRRLAELKIPFEIINQGNQIYVLQDISTTPEEI